MPHGGPVVETIPEQCPNGHALGPPVRGTVRVSVGHRPCSCPSAREAGHHGHRVFACLKPGCNAEILRPACDGPTFTRAIHT